jgi:hypothetical protein
MLTLFLYYYRPFIKPGTDRDVFADAPDNRRDLGAMAMVLHNNDDVPLILKYDEGHLKGKKISKGE